MLFGITLYLLPSLLSTHQALTWLSTNLCEECLYALESQFVTISHFFKEEIIVEPAIEDY
jgi:hypothetical protein